MDVVERAAIAVVGVRVEAGFGELGRAVPAAWRDVFGRRHDLPPSGADLYAEASLHLGGGRYRETVGVALAASEVPGELVDGLACAVLPAGRYVHHRHVGQVREIAEGFGAMYAWAARRGLTLGALKLDLGYSPDGIARPHDLYINLGS